MFYDLDRFIEAQCNDTQHDNARDHHIQLEYLGAVYDQIAKASSCSQEFSDNDPYQSKPDVHFRSAEQNGNGTLQDNL